MQGLNQQNQMRDQQQAIAQGYNTAYQNAQQAQQFGANLGLQGLQGQLAGYGQAGQAAGTLGQLGQTQFGQQQAINQAQQQVGAVQQAQAQQGLDLNYQNFLAQKNYPYQQLGYMSDMLRGLPLSQTSQTMYQAPPNLGSQLGGLGMTALGIYGMSGGFGSGKKRGGKIKAMKKGGKIGYATGGDISLMSTQELTQLLDNPEITPMEADAIQEQLMLRQRMENNPEAGKIMSGQGVDSIPTGDTVPLNMAGGGIIAFAGKGSSQVKDEDEQFYKDYEKSLLESIKNRTAAMSTGDPFAESKAKEAQIQEQLGNINKYSPFQALAQTGLATMAGDSPYALRNIGLGGLEGLKSYSQSKSEADKLNQLLLQQGVEREKSKFGRDTALLGSEQTALGQLIGRKYAADQAAATRALAQSSRESTELTRAQTTYNSLYNNAFDNLTKSAKPGAPNYKKYKEDPDALAADARKIAMGQLAPDLRTKLGMVPQSDAPTIPPPTNKPAATGFPVIVDGKTYNFPTKEAALTFKQKAQAANPKSVIQ
jgi:hypothetical protein